MYADFPTTGSHEEWALVTGNGVSFRERRYVDCDIDSFDVRVLHVYRETPHLHTDELLVQKDGTYSSLVRNLL